MNRAEHLLYVFGLNTETGVFNGNNYFLVILTGTDCYYSTAIAAYTSIDVRMVILKHNFWLWLVRKPQKAEVGGLFDFWLKSWLS